MRGCEFVLYSLLMLMLCFCSYTDLKNNIIKNKYIIRGISLAIVIDCIYYLLFASDYFSLFLSNFLLISLFAFVFYGYKVWAAGDSKLVLLIGLLIPGRFYSFIGLGSITSFIIFLFTFCISFFYVISESLFYRFRDKNAFHFSIEHIDIKYTLFSYLFMVSSSTLFQYIFMFFFRRFVGYNSILMMAIQFLIIISMLKFLKKFTYVQIRIISLILMSVLILLMIFSGTFGNFYFDFKSWLIVFVVFILKSISEEYNYQWILTSKVEKGNILSASTVIQFKQSKVKGLPNNINEDLSARLTEDEAESVRRWEFSKYGKSHVLIVKKIPFALFLSLGTILYLILGVVI